MCAPCCAETGPFYQESGTISGAGAGQGGAERCAPGARVRDVKDQYQNAWHGWHSTNSGERVTSETLQ